MKKIIIALAVLGLLVGIGAFFLIGNLDKIVKGALEGVGSELLGVPVAVSAVDLELKSGSGQISGLTVANPAGYKAPKAFQMEMIRLGINLGSLGKQPIVIDELDIKSPVVELEVKEDGSSNLQILLNNIKQNSARADQKAAEEQPKAEGGAKGEPIRMRFNKLAITGVTVNAVVPGQQPQQLVIPDMVLENVGGESGFTPAELGGLILGNIIGRSLEMALEKKLTEKMEEAAKGLFDDLRKKLVPEKLN
jgi:hypothetical protein